MENANERYLVPVYEFRYTKQLLKPVIDAGEEVAEAMMDNKISISEWFKIMLAGSPLIGTIKDMQHFIAEIQIFKGNPDAAKQLLEWFKEELQFPQANVEAILEGTIKLAIDVWHYIVLLQMELVKPKQAAKTLD